MNKSVVIGLIILVLVIGGGVAFKLVSDGTLQSPGSSDTSSAEPVTAQKLSIAPASGYTLDTVELDGKQVPVLKVPLDTWGGYAALFAANGGAKPSANSLFYKLGGFGVELVPVEGAQAQLDGFASGRYHILWSSMDSLPLLYDALRTDKRLVPQVIGLFDWSVGGDGILVRSNIKTPKDLKGKKILTSGNTPYNFFLLWLLSQSGMSPSDVSMVYIGDGPEAAKAFAKDKSIDAWVSWEPFLSTLTDPESSDYQKDTRLLISSKDANQLIADIYFTRLDLAREHPEMLQAFVEAMIQGEELFSQNPEPTYALMASFFNLEGGNQEAKDMVRNVHIPNWTESRMFFDLNNPINAYKIFYMAQEYYKNVGSLDQNTSWEAETVINTQFLDALEANSTYSSQLNRVKNSFNKQAAFDIADLESQRVVLNEDLKIYFEAQKLDFDINSSRSEIQENRKILETIAEQMDVLGTTALKLIGHLDTTRVEEFKAQGQQSYIEASAQAKLISKKRAEFIKKLLVEQYGCDADRIYTEGRGWDQPIEGADPAENRRVEVRFIAFE